MAFIDEVFKTSGLLERALKVVVVARAEPVSYTGSDGIEKNTLTVAVSDGTTVIMSMVYDSAKFSKFVVGATLSIRSSIRKHENNEKMLVVTKTTKCFMSQSIPEGHAEEGRSLANPHPSEIKPIQQALRSPIKQRVSVAGRIIQEEGIRSVNVKGAEVKIKTIVVGDSSGKAKTSLWRSTSDTDAHTGQYVRITDVVVNHYKYSDLHNFLCCACRILSYLLFPRHNITLT